jgi:hypothetical protein
MNHAKASNLNVFPLAHRQIGWRDPIWGLTTPENFAAPETATPRQLPENEVLADLHSKAFGVRLNTHFPATVTIAIENSLYSCDDSPSALPLRGYSVAYEPCSLWCCRTEHQSRDNPCLRSFEPVLCPQPAALPGPAVGQNKG